MISHDQHFVNKSVCELGSGLGLVSILLDKMSCCRYVYATDGDDETMELLKENIKSTSSSVRAHKLWWGEDADFVKVLENNQHDLKFDVLLAADVIYEEDQFQPLIESVKSLLKNDGEFLLAFARRNVSVDKVLDYALSQGLTWAMLDAGLSGMEPIYSIRWQL